MYLPLSGLQCVLRVWISISFFSSSTGFLWYGVKMEPRPGSLCHWYPQYSHSIPDTPSNPATISTPSTPSIPGTIVLYSTIVRLRPPVPLLLSGPLIYPIPLGSP